MPNTDHYDEMEAAYAVLFRVFLPAALVFPLGVLLTLKLAGGVRQVPASIVRMITSPRKFYYELFAVPLVYMLFLVLPWEINTRVIEWLADTSFAGPAVRSALDLASSVPGVIDIYHVIDKIL